MGCGQKHVRQEVVTSSVNSEKWQTYHARSIETSRRRGRSDTERSCTTMAENGNNVRSHVKIGVSEDSCFAVHGLLRSMGSLCWSQEPSLGHHWQRILRERSAWRECTYAQNNVKNDRWVRASGNEILLLQVLFGEAITSYQQCPESVGSNDVCSFKLSTIISIGRVQRRMKRVTLNLVSRAYLTNLYVCRL